MPCTNLKRNWNIIRELFLWRMQSMWYDAWILSWSNKEQHQHLGYIRPMTTSISIKRQRSSWIKLDYSEIKANKYTSVSYKVCRRLTHVVNAIATTKTAYPASHAGNLWWRCLATNTRKITTGTTMNEMVMSSDQALGPNINLPPKRTSAKEEIRCNIAVLE